MRKAPIRFAENPAFLEPLTFQDKDLSSSDILPPLSLDLAQASTSLMKITDFADEKVKESLFQGINEAELSKKVGENLHRTALPLSVSSRGTGFESPESKALIELNRFINEGLIPLHEDPIRWCEGSVEDSKRFVGIIMMMKNNRGRMVTSSLVEEERNSLQRIKHVLNSVEIKEGKKDSVPGLLAVYIAGDVTTALNGFQRFSVLFTSRSCVLLHYVRFT
ncbi:unnamed protein product [Nezara viridula]|uniref:Uncharacterized protein n=1 Tax=Nezara viridula TaxID=85310 RepID=A0A9P0H3K0_NEZVI|nr:unnamed protein product [Nezara viridula]